MFNVDNADEVPLSLPAEHHYRELRAAYLYFDGPMVSGDSFDNIGDDYKSDDDDDDSDGSDA